MQTWITSLARLARPATFALAVAALSLAGCSAHAEHPAPARDPDVVRISGKEVSIIPQLTMALGNFDKEGVRVALVDDTIYEGPHYRMQRALDRGEIDMSVHWFQHVFFGNAHDEPTVAVMMLNAAPGLTVMVADRVKSRVRSAADFRGLKVAEGMGYSTKSVIMNLLAARSGLAPGSYTRILAEPEGRLEATLRALEAGEVDVIAFREPHTSAILATNRVSTIYDLSSPEETERALGSAYPAQSVFTTPAFLRAHPDQAQRVVNAFVRTMRFVNSHSAEEIAAVMPAEFFAGKDREAEIAVLRASLPSFAKGDYGFKPGHARIMQQAIDSAQYDESIEGQFRAAARNKSLPVERIYDNRLVQRATK